MISGLFKTRAYSKRHYVFVMAFAIVFVGSIFLLEPHVRSYFAADVQNENTADQSHESQSTYSRSAPTRLIIPAINLDTTFVPPLGLLPDQTVSVPDSYTEVGWYSGGASPGEIGPAVILGHVDSKEGPAIFYSLGQLSKGDEIEVVKDDNSVATFIVTKIQRYPQSNFPTMEVYGPNEDSVLRLVTCTGIFDRKNQVYSHNLVVYAKLK